MKRLTTVIILLAIPALVIAGPKRVIKKHMMTGKHMEMTEMLDLNEEQKEQMHQLRVKHQKAIIPITIIPISAAIQKPFFPKTL